MKRLHNRLYSEDDTQNVDMTPLIDMVFILLIFFIVTSVFVKDKGMDIERPGQRSSGQVKKESLLITITAAGALRASGDEISMNNLRGYVSSYLKKLPVPVVIMADKKAPVGLLAEVMDECRLAGARNISLATEDKK
jgi:biopolymer transport protein ExbD